MERIHVQKEQYWTIFCWRLLYSLAGWIHEVVLPDLALNRQTYLYRARVSRDDEYPWSKTYWFSTRSDEPDAEVKIAALGDQDLPTSPGTKGPKREHWVPLHGYDMVPSHGHAVYSPALV